MENKRKHTGLEPEMPLPEGLRLKEEYRASGTLKGRIMERAKRETPEIRHAALEHAGRPATGAGGASENCAEFHAMRKRTAVGYGTGNAGHPGGVPGRKDKRRYGWLYFCGPLAAAIAAAGIFLFVPMSSLKATDTVFDVAAGIFSRSKSFSMTVKVRTEPGENFSYVDPRKGFVRHTLTVEPETGRWRLEKQRKVAVYDGSSIWSWNRPSMLGTKMGVQETGTIGDFSLFLDPCTILLNEKERADSIRWSSYRKVVRGGRVTVTVFTKRQGDFRNDYMLYMSTEEADTRRVYEFDRRSGELTGMKIDMVDGRRAVTVMELERIRYDAEIPESIFDRPEGVDWVDITGEPEGRLFVGITPVQAVARMFHYMDPWRPEVLKEILWSYHLDALKDSYEGSRIRKIGRPFRSGTYCGVYVPVTVERRGGGRERLTIALRNDNPDRVWVVDGGI